MLRQFTHSAKAGRLAVRIATPRSTTATTRPFSIILAPHAPALSSQLHSSLFSTVPPTLPAVRSRQQTSRAAAGFARWYSNEAESKQAQEGAKDAAEATKAGDAAGSEAASEAAPLSAAEAEALRASVKEKTEEVLSWKDKYLRSVADFRNLQERTQRDMKSARDFAITQFAKDLVDSVDNLDRALAMVPESAKSKDASPAAAAAEAANGQGEAGSSTAPSQDLVNLVDGLRMTETVLLQTLKKHGLELFDPVGEKFNPNEHEATFMTPVQDKEHNTVFHTQQKGFRLNGRILRAAKVGVVKNK